MAKPRFSQRLSWEKRYRKDYFPLTVNYEEKFYAAGKILGSRFMRREGRASDDAVLNGRLIDRTIRPLFDQSVRREVQVVVTVLTIDKENDPDFYFASFRFNRASNFPNSLGWTGCRSKDN